jgi:hypothetical protein
MVDGVKLDPLGSCVIGVRVFPEKFRGHFRMGLAGRMVVPLMTGRAAVSAKFIGPANANVLCRANPIASAISIVERFIACSYYRLR